jgi:methylated-DNA-[protein]-cysteine S-methyltransferase
MDYFNGGVVDFTGIPLDLSTATEFQKKVYSVARKIPYGETRSYGWVARSLGSSSAARAVGNALRLNPVPIIVPCHRVVGSRRLGGFTPSIDLKRRLLSLEGVL